MGRGGGGGGRGREEEGEEGGREGKGGGRRVYLLDIFDTNGYGRVTILPPPPQF